MIFKPAPKPSGQKSPHMSVLAAILCLSLLLSLVISAVSCGTNFFYQNSDKYTVGGASLSHPISAIDIEWISGHVNVKYSNDGENEVVFSESYDKKLDDDLLLHYWLDGTTLRIKFAAS